MSATTEGIACPSLSTLCTLLMHIRIHLDEVLLFPLPFTDSSLTHSNITNALTSVGTNDLLHWLMIPPSVEEKITDQYKDDGEQRQKFVTFYLQYSPYSTSWTLLAGELHRREATTAEGMVNKFLQGTPGVCAAWDCVYVL